MINAEDVGPDSEAGRSAGLRIGTPERQTAEDALEAHLVAKRLDSAEYSRRVEACQSARTWAELVRIFDDLPLPHPELPSATAPPTADEGDDMPPAAVAGCLSLGLGLPVAVVLGLVYGTWWALAVPVAVTVVMGYVEQLRARPRAHAPGNGSQDSA